MKRLGFLLVIMLVGALSFMGCGNDDDSGTDSDSDTDTDADTDTDTDTDSDTDTDTDSDSDTDTDTDTDSDGEVWFMCPEEDYPDEDFPDGVTVVTAFDHVYQYFGKENFREVTAEVEFPKAADWSYVGMVLDLECPESGLCDHWDRAAYVRLVNNPEDKPAEWDHTELLRYVTPYRIEMCNYIDVTHLAPLLTGTQTLSSFIDTWVGPGHEQGEGWNVTVKFAFFPPKKEVQSEPVPSEVINVWGTRVIVVGEIEEDVNVDSQIDPVTISIPKDATRVVAHLTTTGHSFGNTLNCAEFCQMRQDLYVNGELFSENPWRNDCGSNPTGPQYGTWKYGRNGWCPGAVAVGQMVDITSAAPAGEDTVLDFDIVLASNGAEYDNLDPVDWLPEEKVALRVYVYND